MTWTANPCDCDAGWTGPTVCRRPYGRGLYNDGPYGRCEIIGEVIWGESMLMPPFTPDIPCAPVWGPPTAMPTPWRRSVRG